MKLINKKEEKKMNIVTKVVMIIVFVIMGIAFVIMRFNLKYTIMNENIDLTKILKDCPKGTKFYFSIYG